MSEVSPNFKKPKRKRKKKQSMTDACDEVFGKIVRSRGACESCGQTWDLQCAHGFSRSYRAVRWDERNAFCLCKAEHMRWTHRPLEWDVWLRERWGEELYAEIRALALTHVAPDLKDTLERLNRRLDEIEAAA